MAKAETSYLCSKCGYKTVKWFGRCPSCGAWNTLEEEIEEEKPARRQKSTSSRVKPVRFKDISGTDYLRARTGIAELDRVLGGGIVKGSVVLIAGEPGIGKSTLLMQISDILSKGGRVLYISGEESENQLKYRAERLGVDGEELYVLTETDIDAVLDECNEMKPDFVIVDSIQTVSSDLSSSSPGSVTQIKECTMQLISFAKSTGSSVLIVGHVNKEGGIAGPKVLEHMVDAVLTFEGDREQIYRIIRASKNRYGSTNEIGVFEMTGEGLAEVPNPSEMLLSARPKGISGNCAVCVMEGSRPLITEIQALVSKSVFPSPRRMSNGIDYNRLYMMLAVLEKRFGLKFSLFDAYVNVIGGIRFDEPASDLAAALALVSSLRDIPVPDDVIAFGEIGLAGEVRNISAPDLRLNEAVRLGFSRIILPRKNAESIKKAKIVPDGIEIIPVRSIFDAIKIFGNNTND